MALGAHDRAASRVAAKAAASVAMFEAEMKSKQRMIQVGRNSEHGANPILVTTRCYLKCFANSIGYIPGYRIFHQAQAPPRLCSGLSDHLDAIMVGDPFSEPL